MKKVLSLSLFVAIILLGLTTANAQERGREGRPDGPPPIPGPEQVEQIAADLAWELTLEPDQAKKFQEVFISHMGKVADYREAQQSAHRQEMDVLKSDLTEELSGVLTEAQLAKLKDLHPRKHRNGKERGRKGNRDGKCCKKRPHGR